jgi:hypothetical protein
MLALSPETLGSAPNLSEWPLDGRLSNLVTLRFDMDDDEARRFALACGGAVATMTGYAPFDRHLRCAIHRYGLTNLFQDVGSGRHHQAIKPTASRTRSSPTPWRSGAQVIVRSRRRTR